MEWFGDAENFGNSAEEVVMCDSNKTADLLRELKLWPGAITF